MEQTNKIANPINNLSYDKTSAISIFEYSKGLLGRSLREFIKENYSPKKGKGGIGQMVENLYFLFGNQQQSRSGLLVCRYGIKMYSPQIG